MPYMLRLDLKCFYWGAFVGYEYMTVLILSSRSANDRSRYKITRPLIGWPQAKNQPCMSFMEAKNLSSGTSDATSFVR